MRSTEGQAVGFKTFYCDECKQDHPQYVATEHPHYSKQIMRNYQRKIAPLRECEHGVRYDPKVTSARNACDACYDNQRAHY